MWDETGKLFIVIPGSHRIIPQLLLLKNRTTKSRSHKINLVHTQPGARLHSPHNSKHTRCIPAEPIPSHLPDPAQSSATGDPRQLLPRKGCHKAPNLNPQMAEFMKQQQNFQPSFSTNAVCAAAARPRGGATPGRWRRTGAVSARGRGTRGWHPAHHRLSPLLKLPGCAAVMEVKAWRSHLWGILTPRTAGSAFQGCLKGLAALFQCVKWGICKFTAEKKTPLNFPRTILDTWLQSTTSSNVIKWSGDQPSPTNSGQIRTRSRRIIQFKVTTTIHFFQALH